MRHAPAVPNWCAIPPRRNYPAPPPHSIIICSCHMRAHMDSTCSSAYLVARRLLNAARGALQRSKRAFITVHATLKGCEYQIAVCNTGCVYLYTPRVIDYIKLATKTKNSHAAWWCSDPAKSQRFMDGPILMTILPALPRGAVFWPVDCGMPPHGFPRLIHGNVTDMSERLLDALKMPQPSFLCCTAIGRSTDFSTPFGFCNADSAARTFAVLGLKLSNVFVRIEHAGRVHMLCMLVAVLEATRTLRTFAEL